MKQIAKYDRLVSSQRYFDNIHIFRVKVFLPNCVKIVFADTVLYIDINLACFCASPIQYLDTQIYIYILLSVDQLQSMHNDISILFQIWVLQQ